MCVYTWTGSLRGRKRWSGSNAADDAESDAIMVGEEMP
jgi:hypothetical protein